jgi:hypothetical protein
MVKLDVCSGHHASGKGKCIIYKIQMKSFMVYCTLETEEPFMVEAETLQEAQQEALKELGWHLIESEDDEEDSISI